MAAREHGAKQQENARWEPRSHMSTFCLYVKASVHNRGTPVLSITRSGPTWSGTRLRLVDAARLGLAHGDLLGWSDFYGGTVCDVHVANASEGQHEGWLVWGGNLGLRSVPAGFEDVGMLRSSVWDGLPLLWVNELRHFPPEVVAAVTVPRRDEWATEAVSARG